MKKIINAFLLLALMAAQSCGGDEPNGNGTENGGTVTEEEKLEPASVTKSNTMSVYAHYMPWFETPATNNGAWGQHWTMATRNPQLTDANGRRQIASHYYPLTGPYASSDPVVLDYQCLLMKYSGIDGVMVDWYGTQSKNDYPANNTNTLALLKAVAKAKLKLAIVYEDATLDGLNEADKADQARADMTYLQTNFFKNSCYAKVGDKPLLLIFGPQQITKPSTWTHVFSMLSTKPQFVALNGHSSRANDASNTNCQGEYVWVNPNPDYASLTRGFNFYIAGAMPGFKDFYKQGGWGEGYTTYADENGALFNRQLQAAKASGLGWLQVSTWNDYGEGTIIEPTVEFGYRYLKALQSFTGVIYNESNLAQIFRWYELRVKYSSNAAKTKILTQCYTYFNALKPDKAVELMDKNFDNQ